MILAEIPYPRIDPVIVQIGPVGVRWYGVSYVLAFALAWLVLKGLAKRGRWPVAPDRVGDVLFWGILGVFLGGRIGWILFYALPLGHYDWTRFWRVWEGGMSFHGGLLGVVVAYWLYTWRTRAPRGAFFDGLTLATPLGIFCVRMANFVNGELYGRPWDGPWAMRFPLYQEFGGPEGWAKQVGVVPERQLWTEPRHPSQLYEALGEGLLMYVFLRWLMLRRGVGGGRIAATFLVGYGLVRFLAEFLREPDSGLGLAFLGVFTRGQQLSLLMVTIGVVTFAVIAARSRRRPEGGEAA